MSSLIREIKDAKKELENLERQYIEETEPCHNTKCTFYCTRSTLNCSWTVLVEECRDYLDEDNE